MKLAFIVIVGCLFFSCSEKRNTENSTNYEAILPHSNVGDAKDLNESDLEKLQLAKGRNIREIKGKDLRSLFEKEDRLIVANFWTLGDTNSTDRNKVLLQFESLFEEKYVTILLVNLDDKDKQKDINLYLRKNDFISRAFQLSPSSMDNFSKKLNINKLDLQSGLLIWDKTEGISDLLLDIQDAEELKALLEPYLL